MTKKNQKKKEVRQVKSKSQSFLSNLNSIVENKHFGLFIAAAYLIIISIISFTYHKIGDYGVETDFFWGYVHAAKKFLEGIIVIDQFRGPLYPIALGIFSLAFPDFFSAGIFLGVFSASIVIYFTFETLKRISDSKISLITTILLFFNPIFIQYSYSAGTDMFFNALAVITLYFFFKSNEPNYKNLLLAAFFGGLSYLTRYNGIFLASFVLAILFINHWKISWKERIKAVLIFCFVFIITFSPWGFYCLSEKGSFFYNENYKNIAYEIYGKEKVSWDEFWFSESSKMKSLTDVVFADPGKFVSTVIGNIADHFLKDMEILIGWHIGIFTILGLVFFIFSKPHKPLTTVFNSYVLVNLFFFLLLLLVFYSERFSLFLIPFYVFFAVSALHSGNLSLKKFMPKQLIILLTVFIISFAIIEAYGFNVERIDSGPQEILILKEWYDKNVPEEQKGSKIAARKPHIAYYLDMEFSLLPLVNSHEELISELNKKNVDYLYFSPVEAGLRREFMYLLNPNLQHPGLETVVFFNNPPAVLYRLKK
ncbi:MAG: glycosyltransferase family 39 protein [Ignavibacteriaceae bacterium]|nr:glycosyltransferase family 39 protein [Ignavibacteriaceae bacterium]